MYVTPLVLTALIVNDLITELKAPYGGYDLSGVLLIGPVWMVVILIASLFISNYPWKKELQDNHH